MINTAYFLLVFIVYSVMGEMSFSSLDLKNHEALDRLTVILFMVVSAIPTAPIVKAEY